ncbi:hypothetical protein [Clostridium beijerinckii]|uniref:Uncharacterized protein n=1 Tax=Clostridium beijerinckii TaxID=1520 RepID=A0A9Q5CP90_CLOBE|nr:hypothetical protein [Clostridium beijerinckii]AQS06151.1 hypothetical protein CLBIJ_35940 [Clostridium beijerinckii]MBA2886188.1 hypothetical protein [Clostridium beijerinckii]MBA2900954.1 hypothetical protein [Clostridium beijerinckii]MBA2910747.1 hypothetical protein [Clostridium beijerinckii]MBA9014242.1 hypothetical protein [Clostridium beijerinckii]
MNYKYEYKSLEERESLITTHSNLFLVEEQNITDGNFLIFVDEETKNQLLVQQTIRGRVNTITAYASLDNNSVDSLENAIIEYETNLITGGIF